MAVDSERCGLITSIIDGGEPTFQSEWTQRVALHDLYDFLPTIRVIGVDHAQRHSKYVSAIAPKFSRSDSGANKLSLLEGIPLRVGEHHDVNALILFRGGRFGVDYREARTALHGYFTAISGFAAALPRIFDYRVPLPRFWKRKGESIFRIHIFDGLRCAVRRVLRWCMLRGCLLSRGMNLPLRNCCDEMLHQNNAQQNNGQ
jgi:hypothetical protein